MIDCSKVDPSSGCKYVVGRNGRGVLRKAADHAKEHGIRKSRLN